MSVQLYAFVTILWWMQLIKREEELASSTFKRLALITLYWSWVLLEHMFYELPEDPNNILFTANIHRI